MQPTNVQEPPKSGEIGEFSQSPKQKMSEKEKGFLWTGITIVLLVVIFVVIFVVIPHVIALAEHCSLYAMSGNKCSTISGMNLFGLLGSLSVGLPLALTGSTFILYAVFSWKKVKQPGLTTALIILLCTVLLVLLILGFNITMLNNIHPVRVQ